MINYKNRNIDFIEVSHKSDAAILVYGYSLSELFYNAKKGMYHIMGVATIDKPKKYGVIELQSYDVETLMVAYLSELLYLAEINIGIVLNDIWVNNNQLSAKIIKTPLMSISREIKAVTFSELKICLKNGVYQSKIVFDL